MKQRVLVIFGTRPEAIKMAPVIRAIKAEPQFFTPLVCVTAQHRQMLDQVMALFDITPEYDLDIMRPGQNLFDLTARALLSLREVMAEARPDIVLVHGDTTTSFVAALAAFYEHVPVAHVEAGLRTGNLQAPFPEEANRQLTARLACLHFAPTERNRASLIAEGVPAERIHVTGNTVIDALLTVRDQVVAWPADRFGDAWGSAADAVHSGAPLILVTGHRRENFGPGFLEICRALRAIARRNPHVQLIYPVHPNPNVKNTVYTHLADISNIFLVPPMEYAPFVYLMNRSTLIITDSGGIQEEAPSLGKPVLVMREATERPDASGSSRILLVGTNAERIVSEAEKLLAGDQDERPFSNIANPYGDGHAAHRIIQILKERM